jgi:hypothetical protein
MGDASDLIPTVPGLIEVRVGHPIMAGALFLGPHRGTQ